ncbi:hypothetical protein FIBSPDRAFT_1043933 [Athelia psychrophila]|uniref:Uncharacterized protein n=1 Tax=Athelia psychrophila TaxID=1759441 RepID=A0A166KEX2_9AGAM|nr:hypothetical protein FIBSPDRAFT_1043933 [Fibularhizoctonia sp. CBS 109695]
MLPLLSTTIYLLICSLNGVDALAVDTTITSLPTSGSSSILAESVNATASSQRCGDIDNCRTLDGIVQSCIVTIVACAWFAVHRNIPAPEPKPSPHRILFLRCTEWAWRPVLDQMESLIVFLVAFLAPEIILAWAIRQAIVALMLYLRLEEIRSQAVEAGNRQNTMEDAAEIARRQPSFYRFITRIRASLRERHNVAEEPSFHGRILKFIDYTLKSSSIAPSHAPCKICKGDGNQCHMVAGARRVAKGDECWTWSHGFFLAMGGFHLYDKDGPLYPLSPANVLELVARGHLVPPTADEISDKSKGDWLSKGVAISQTAWFVVQCITRHVHGLPVTRLEVMTLAYTVITVAMYVVWWKKPLNVQCAVRVPKEEVEEEKVHAYASVWDRIGVHVMGHQDDYVDLRKCKGVPTLWAGKPDYESAQVADVIAVFAAMAFGALHCIAWHSEFQSHLEQELWRSSTIAIIAVPPALMVIGFAAQWFSIYFESKKKARVVLTGVLYAALFAVYTAARVILAVLSFTSLRGLPYAAYETLLSSSITISRDFPSLLLAPPHPTSRKHVKAEPHHILRPARLRAVLQLVLGQGTQDCSVRLSAGVYLKLRWEKDINPIPESDKVVRGRRWCPRCCTSPRRGQDLPRTYHRETVRLIAHLDFPESLALIRPHRHQRFVCMIATNHFCLTDGHGHERLCPRDRAFVFAPTSAPTPPWPPAPGPVRQVTLLLEIYYDFTCQDLPPTIEDAHKELGEEEAEGRGVMSVCKVRVSQIVEHHAILYPDQLTYEAPLRRRGRVPRWALVGAGFGMISSSPGPCAASPRPPTQGPLRLERDHRGAGAGHRHAERLSERTRNGATRRRPLKLIRLDRVLPGAGASAEVTTRRQALVGSGYEAGAMEIEIQPQLWIQILNNFVAGQGVARNLVVLRAARSSKRNSEKGAEDVTSRGFPKYVLVRL